MKVNYTEICRVVSLEADFQQVSLVLFFSGVIKILLSNINYSKLRFLRLKFLFTIEIAYVRPIMIVNSILR